MLKSRLQHTKLKIVKGTVFSPFPPPKSNAEGVKLPYHRTAHFSIFWPFCQ